MGPLQHKGHYTQPQLLPPLHSLLGAEVEGGIHQRQVPLRGVVEGGYLKLRMHQADDKTTHYAKFNIFYPSFYVHGI